MNPRIKILILNWNGSELTQNCLKSIENLQYDNFTTTVIDNASSDDSIAMIHEKFPNVDVLALDQNYGFAPAYNMAFQHEKNGNSDFYLILNNDTTVEPNLLSELVITAQKFGKEHLYCPLINYMDEPEIIWYAGGNVNLSTGVLDHQFIRRRYTEQFNGTVNTDFTTGCCIFTSTDTIEKLSGFDVQFNMYAEDVDLCLRAKSMGIHSYFVSSTKIYHKVSASVGGEFSKDKIKRKLASINLLMKIHCSPLQRIIGFPLYIIRSVFSLIRSLI